MISNIDTEKISSMELVKNICDEIELNKLHVFSDPMSKKYSNSNKLQMEYFI